MKWHNVEFGSNQKFFFSVFSKFDFLKRNLYFRVTANIITSNRKWIKIMEFHAFCKESMLHIKKYFKINIAKNENCLPLINRRVRSLHWPQSCRKHVPKSHGHHWQCWSWNTSWCVAWPLCKKHEIPWLWSAFSSN